MLKTMFGAGRMSWCCGSGKMRRGRYHRRSKREIDVYVQTAKVATALVAPFAKILRVFLSMLAFRVSSDGVYSCHPLLRGTGHLQGANLFGETGRPKRMAPAADRGRRGRGRGEGTEEARSRPDRRPNGPFRRYPFGICEPFVTSTRCSRAPATVATQWSVANRLSSSVWNTYHLRERLKALAL